MKRTLLASLLVALTSAGAHAADGYKIKIKFSDAKDSMVYLAHYYAKPLPTIYKTDSARIGKDGVAVMESKENTLGGIYMILMEDKQRYFEFLLNNGDNMTINAAANNLPQSLKFTGSEENVRFSTYVNFLQDFGKKSGALEAELKSAKTKADTAAIYEKGQKLSKELTKYREDYMEKYKGTLLANIFSALKVPKVPEIPKKSDGTVDSSWGYYYYKAHYWDGFDFNDDRLIHTPIYDSKLDEYFNKWVLPSPDTVEYEADQLLKKTRGRKELFKYTLHWVTQWAQESKVMGLDEVFVYMVENYHMKGDAYWMDNETLSKYIDRAQKVAPNVLGNLAPELKLTSIDGKPRSMSSVDAKYTLLVFWDPDCGHCQTEVPKLDSLYKADLKKRGVQIYAMQTGGTEEEDIKKWKAFIDKHGLKDWIHVYDPDHKSNYKSLYDVYATPMVYLLDEKKIIKGKKLDHTTIPTLFEILDKKAAAASKKSK